MANRHPETWLVPYVRDELPPADRERVARHLAACPACRHEAEALGALLADLGRTAPAPPPVHWRRWRAELGERLAARRRRRAWWRGPVPVAVGSALAAAALVAALVGLPGTGERRELLAFEEAVVGDRLDLLRHYAVLERLDLLEDLEVIRHLDALAERGEG